MALQRRCTLIAGIVSAVVFCFCCVFLQIWIETTLYIPQQHEPIHLETHPTSKLILGIVLPLSTEEMSHAVELLQHWPTKCSETTLSKMDLIFYFAEEVIPDLDHQLGDASASTSCFKKTKMVSAALHPGEISDQDVRSAQFYKLFLDPDVRAYFVEYDAIAILDWDIILVHEASFERLYATTFAEAEPFWIMGSRHTESYYEDEALTGMRHHLDHPDSIAIYNNTDFDFFHFVNFTLERWQFTRPYDAALWATILDCPYSWPLWQQYASKFVLTRMVSMVEILDFGDEEVTNGIDPEVLFLRMPNTEKNDRPKTVTQHFGGCHQACGYSGAPVKENGVSKVCDATCVNSGSWMNFRFNGHNCGAGDVSKYGKSCRLCFTDQQAALDAEQALVDSNGSSWTSRDHVIMCDTKRPPEAFDCSSDCKDNTNTVCDRTCGTGRYGDWHCNWRSLGKNCRFCFRDITAARKADKLARGVGGRVIMCETHEVPPEGDDITSIESIGPLIRNDMEMESKQPTPRDGAYFKEPSNVNPTLTPFLGDIMRGDVCIFIPGYFEFFHEARIAVESISTFMPGVKVVIATHPMDHHVFYRALDKPNAAVSVVNNTRVDLASLVADKTCGNNTRVIYYMNPGEVLSRPFTTQDTHSSKGKLLVKYTDAGLIGGEYARRSMGTAALLGFHGISFTYGSDLILPAEINAQLRAILRVAMNKSRSERSLDHEDDFSTLPYQEFLDSISSIHTETISIFIPELLAALLFMMNPEKVQFIDPSGQRHHDSTKSIIRYITHLKPRFGCSIDLSLTLQGYDVAQQLDNHVEAFHNGARCDLGFIEVDPETLKLKTEWEFPTGHPISDMPSLRDYRISIMYRTFSGDAELFEISFPTAIKYIPDAFEMVVVVEEVDKDLFEKLLAPHRESAPFPLRVVSEPAIMDGHIQQKYSKMRADHYAEGDYILHLDSDVLVLRDVTYEDIFHLGKPVLPFRRYRDDTQEGLALTMCWQNGTSLAIGEEVVHEFSIFNTHVYPRQMYPALRDLVEKKHGKSFTDFMSIRVGKCSSAIDLASWTADKRSRLLSDFNLMGAFLWYHMPGAVYWMAADPYDLRPDQWRVDLSRYEWVCQANGRSLPKDIAGREQFKADFLGVSNSRECNSVYEQWTDARMKRPETRTKVLVG